MRKLVTISIVVVALISSCSSGSGPNNVRDGGNTVEPVTVDDRIRKTPSELVVKKIESEKKSNWTDDSYDMVFYYVHIPDMDISSTYDDFVFVDTLGKFKVGDRVKIEFMTTAIRER